MLHSTTPASDASAVVLGTFDGVHRGHRSLLARAKALDLPVCVYTFLTSPHGAPALTLPEDRKSLLLANGADRVVFADFTQIRSLSPEDFVSQILIDTLGARHVICGFNYRFGAGAAGTPEMLKRLLAPHAVPLTVLPAVLEDGEPISSTRIRNLLLEKKPECAERLLSRPFFYRLPVREGAKIGRTIGFPTANQHIPSILLRLPNGVYATEAEIGGIPYPAVTNIGSRPTVNQDQSDITCETHIIGYHGDLYGADLPIRFLAYLRDEQPFADLAALRAQIDLDCQSAVRLFAHRRNS